MGGIRPPLHQSMKGLVVGPPLSVGKGKDEVIESRVLDPILDVICELIIPHPSSVKVPGALKCVEIKLQLKQGVIL